MKAAATLALACLALAAPGALAEPPSIPDSLDCKLYEADMPDLIGKEQRAGATSSVTARYWLLPDSKLGNVSFRKGAPNAKWKREDDTLIFDHYDGATTYVGKLVGDRVVGTVTSQGATLGEFQYKWCKLPAD